MPNQSQGGQASGGFSNANPGRPEGGSRSGSSKTGAASAAYSHLQKLVGDAKVPAFSKWKEMVGERDRKRLERLSSRAKDPSDKKIGDEDVLDAIEDAYKRANEKIKQNSEEFINTLSSTLIQPLGSIAKTAASEFGGKWGSTFASSIGTMGNAVKGFLSGNPAAGVAGVMKAIGSVIEAFIKQIGENYKYLKQMQEESAKTAVMLGNAYADAQSSMGRMTGAGLAMEIGTGISPGDLQNTIRQAMSMGIISGESQAYGSQFGQGIAGEIGTNMTDLFGPRMADEVYNQNVAYEVGEIQRIRGVQQGLEDNGGVSLSEQLTYNMGERMVEILSETIDEEIVKTGKGSAAAAPSLYSAEQQNRFEQQQEFFNRYFQQATGVDINTLEASELERLADAARMGTSDVTQATAGGGEGIRDEITARYATAARWGQSQEMGLAEELQGLERAGYSQSGAMSAMQSYQKAGIVGVGNQSEFLLDLANIARTTGVAVEEFGQRTQDVAGTLAKFGTTQEEVVAVSRRFSRELDIGRMSMGTLNSFISGMGISGMGSGGARAFIAEQALLQGDSFTEGMGTETASAVTDLMGELGGTNDPYQRQALMRYRMQQEGGTGRSAGIAMANQVLWQQTGQILGMSADEAMQTEQGKATFLDTAQRMAPQLGVEVSDLIQEQEDLFDLSMELRDFDEITADATQGMLQVQDEIKGTVEDLYAETVQMHQDSKTAEQQLNELMRINTLSTAQGLDALIMGLVDDKDIREQVAMRSSVVRQSLVQETLMGISNRAHRLGDDFSMSLGERAIMGLGGESIYYGDWGDYATERGAKEAERMTDFAGGDIIEAYLQGGQRDLLDELRNQSQIFKDMQQSLDAQYEDPDTSATADSTKDKY